MHAANNEQSRVSDLENQVRLLFRRLEDLNQQYDDLNAESSTVPPPSLLVSNQHVDQPRPVPVDPVEILCVQFRDELTNTNNKSESVQIVPPEGFGENITLEERILLRGTEYLQKEIAEKEKLVTYLGEVLRERRRTKETERHKTNKRLEAKRKMGAAKRIPSIRSNTGVLSSTREKRKEALSVSFAPSVLSSSSLDEDAVNDNENEM